MATKLINTITRELLGTTIRYKGGQERSVIVSLPPGDIIQFRGKGLKKTYEIHLGHCLNLAEIIQNERDYKEAVKDYKERKKLGRAKRPKKRLSAFNKIYFKALKCLIIMMIPLSMAAQSYNLNKTSITPEAVKLINISEGIEINDSTVKINFTFKTKTISDNNKTLHLFEFPKTENPFKKSYLGLMIYNDKYYIRHSIKVD